MEATQAPPAEGQVDGNGDVPLEGEEEQPEVRRIVIEGDGQLTLAVGGSPPSSSVIVLRGGAIPLEGQVKKGQFIEVRMKLRCVDVQFPDKIDPTTGEVTDTTRRQVMRPMAVHRIAEE